MFIRKISTFVVLAAVAASSVSCSSDASPTTPADARQLVTASGHPEWPPIMFRSGSNIDGAGPALVKKIFDGLGWPTAFPYTGTWDVVQSKARSGEVDVLVAAYKTAERETYMVYSDAYTTDPVVLYVGKGKGFPFNDQKDLIGKKGVALVGDSYGQSFDDFAAANLQLVRVTTNAEAYGMLSSGQAEYFINALYAGDDYLKKSGTASQFESLPRFIANENFYITISKKSPFVSYIPLINEQIAKYKADGTISTLIAAYKNK